MKKVLTGFVMLAAIAVASAFGLACGDDGSGGDTMYTVDVQFNESVTEADLDEASDLLRGYDPDAEFLILEIFPPIGNATLENDAPDFCATVEAELEAKSYVRGVECSIAVEVSDGDGDADAPVSATPTG